ADVAGAEARVRAAQARLREFGLGPEEFGLDPDAALAQAGDEGAQARAWAEYQTAGDRLRAAEGDFSRRYPDAGPSGKGKGKLTEGQEQAEAVVERARERFEAARTRLARLDLDPDVPPAGGPVGARSLYDDFDGGSEAGGESGQTVTWRAQD